MPSRKSREICKRRRRLLTGRRCVFLVCWTVLVAGLYGIVGYVAWRQLRDHGDRIATIAWGEGTVTYERMEVTAEGNIEIDGLSVTRPGGIGDPLFSADRVRVKIDLRDIGHPSVDSVEVDRPKILIVGEGLREGAAEKAPVTGDDAFPEWLRVGRVAIRDGEFKLAVPGFPSVSLGYELEATGLDPSRSGEIATGPVRLALRDVRVVDAASGARMSLERAEAKLRVGADLASGGVESLRVDGLEAKVTRSLWQAILGGEAKPDSADSEAPPWFVKAIDIAGAKFEVESYAGEGVVIPDFRAEVDAELRDLQIRDDGGISRAIQTFRLHNVVLDAARDGLPTGAVPPMLSIPEVEVTMVPDDFVRDCLVEGVLLRDPALSIDRARVGRFLDFPTTSSVNSPPSAAADDTPEISPVFKIRNLSVEGGTIDAEPGQIMAGLPAVSARFRMETLGKPEDASARYALELNELRLDDNGRSERPFGRAGRVRIEITPEGVQDQNRVEAIEIDRLDLTLGEEVLRLKDAYLAGAEAVTSSDIPLKDEEADPGIPWRAGRVEVRESRLTLVDMVPGLPFVPIYLNTSLDDVPLTGQAREQERLQRIELSRLEITSPYDSLTPVANLKTIFIEFTFPGLLRNEIEQIEIVSPEIFVGEPLFWYIDHYRGMSENSDVPEVETEPAAPVEIDEKGTITALEDAFRDATFSGWRIKRIQAHSGKIIVAPKGQALGIFPFPFSFESDLEKRLLSVQLKVQSGDYVFEKLKAELLGLSGESYFNYPIRDKDNNFVQTFTALGLRFKNYDAQKIALTVTYDRAGIYGKLWSAAYGGDLNAEFNIYVGDTYKWDAWASAVGFDLGPFTNAAAPDSFRMKGILDGKLVAKGEEFRIDRAYGDASLGAGTMHIKKLDDFVESLPDGWSELQKAIAKAGIDVFRNYDFSAGKAALDLTGRAGTASLFLEGPDGKRDLAFRFFDERDVAAAPVKKEWPAAADAR